jgi:hypothetical protein
MTVPLSLQTTENLATPIRGLHWYYLNWSIDAYPICHNQVNSLELDTVIPGSNADVDHANLGFRKRLSLHRLPGVTDYIYGVLEHLRDS